MDRKHAAAMNYYAAQGGLAPTGTMPLTADKAGPGAGLYASPAAFAPSSPYSAAPSGLGLAPQRGYPAPGTGMGQYAMVTVPSPYPSAGGFQPLSSTAYPAISQGGGFYTMPSVYSAAVPTLASTSPVYGHAQYAASPYPTHAPTLAAPGSTPTPYPTPLPASQALYAAGGYPGFSSAPTRSYSQVAPLPYGAPQPSTTTYPGASSFGLPY